jgi:hypothetical protein
MARRIPFFSAQVWREIDGFQSNQSNQCGHVPLEDACIKLQLDLGEL